MNKEKELVKNTAILGLGNFLPKLVSVITLPIITAQLTKAEFGTYDLISTLVMLLLPIATLQLQTAAFRFLIDYRGDKVNSSKIITNILVFTLPISIIVSIGIMIFWNTEAFLTRILIGTYFLVDIINIIVSQISRGLAYNKYYSISAVLLSIINGIAIVLIVYLKNYGLNGVIISLIIANIIATIYLIVKVKLFTYVNKKMISKKTIKEMISYSWPMIPNNLSNWVLKLSDRLIIVYFIGIEANATYAAANKIPNLLSMAQSIFNMAWQENASLVVKEKDATEYYSKMFSRIFNLMFGFTALLISFSPIMFNLLIKGDYDDAYLQMLVLFLGMFFYSLISFQGGIYVAHKKTKSVGITTIMAAGCNLIINLLLIKFIGVTAASLSTMIAYFLLYLFRLIDIQKFQKIKYSVKKQIICIGILVMMLLICSLRIGIIDIINIVFGLSIFIFTNKDLLNIIIKKIYNYLIIKRK